MTPMTLIERVEAAEGVRMRVWWIPQVPMEPFLVDVADLAEAALISDTLARYDSFQFENRIKPDYCNMGGLSVLIDGEWIDWEDPETGDSFDEWRREHPASLRALASKD